MAPDHPATAEESVSEEEVGRMMHIAGAMVSRPERAAAVGAERAVDICAAMSNPLLFAAGSSSATPDAEILAQKAAFIANQLGLDPSLPLDQLMAAALQEGRDEDGQAQRREVQQRSG